MKRKTALLGILLVTLVLIIPSVTSLAKPEWFIQYHLTTQEVIVTEVGENVYYELWGEGTAMGPNIKGGTANAHAWGQIFPTHSTMKVYLWIYDKDGSCLKFYDWGTYETRNKGIQDFKNVQCKVIAATGKFEDLVDVGEIYMKEGWISGGLQVHGKLYPK